jgi:hypothetical protein
VADGATGDEDEHAFGGARQLGQGGHEEGGRQDDGGGFGAVGALAGPTPELHSPRVSGYGGRAAALASGVNDDLTVGVPAAS